MATIQDITKTLASHLAALPNYVGTESPDKYYNKLRDINKLARPLAAEISIRFLRIVHLMEMLRLRILVIRMIKENQIYSNLSKQNLENEYQRYIVVERDFAYRAPS
ncbi:hypothetical protein RhiirA4_450288 [Rhizophagus irregularis]|uniref:Uncharacterized protein n=1 Tax=Rhizophagus irregularis TaxID=588596 RepID=A0A2I1FSW9_9GLOM|nr:hypothetical protein RhiirA4_450288 [Rhizophagus irregularis]